MRFFSRLSAIHVVVVVVVFCVFDISSSLSLCECLHRFVYVSSVILLSLGSHNVRFVYHSAFKSGFSAISQTQQQQ